MINKNLTPDIFLQNLLTVTAFRPYLHDPVRRLYLRKGLS